MACICRTDSIMGTVLQLKDQMKDRLYGGKDTTLVHNGKITDSKLNVTLVSQLIISRLEAFSQVIEAWEGPISISIYLIEMTDIDKLIEFLKIPKNLKMYSRLTIVLVKPNYNHVDHLAYPINHLRNLAITESHTEYIFVTDAVPSINLYSIIQSRLIPRAIKSSDKKTAWVVPCFMMDEMYKQIPAPDTIHEWHSLINQGVAYMTDNGPSLAQPLLKNSALDYEVCYEFQWEPHYIIHRTAPLYDVRFRNQGGDRKSHALQLNAERYKFKVLHKAFMVCKDSQNWPVSDNNQRMTKSYFEVFMKEIKSIYGMNPKWPRGCSAMAIGWKDHGKSAVGLAVGAA